MAFCRGMRRPVRGRGSLGSGRLTGVPAPEPVSWSPWDDDAASNETNTVARRTYEWYRQPPEPRETLAMRRGLAWLDTPNGKIATAQVACGVVPPQLLLTRARETIVAGALPESATPMEAEESLREILANVLNLLTSAGDIGSSEA